MACSGCGHRYNPGSPPPIVTRGQTVPGATVLGRYHLQKRPILPPTQSSQVVKVATPVTKESK